MWLLELPLEAALAICGTDSACQNGVTRTVTASSVVERVNGVTCAAASGAGQGSAPCYSRGWYASWLLQLHA